MGRRLILLNALLVGVSLASVVSIVRQVTPRAAASAAPPRLASPPTVSAPAAAPRPSPPTGNYGAVVSRNLFSPDRTEAGRSPTGGGAGSAPSPPKPNLYGVVLRDDAPIAYFEDPATNHVTGFRTGDTVAGGRVQLITADHVVLVRPDGPVEVELTDPAKPRPQAPSPPPAPGQIAPPPGGVPEPGMPRVEGHRRPRDE
jgi:hypothetical protein